MTEGLVISTTRRLHPTQAIEVRALLDRAFGADFDQYDFEHALGGEHVFAHPGHTLVAHAWSCRVQCGSAIAGSRSGTSKRSPPTPTEQNWTP